jgi:signal transduction histidine kinase/CheY-like chemotaxis protein/GAF domain-containing protein/HPt (histidine-containing phosphotransfer) domain-containing protein
MDDSPGFTDVDAGAAYAPAVGIAQQAEILRAMVLSLPDGVAFADADGTTRLANDAYIADLDMERGEFARMRGADARFRWLFETGQLALTHATVDASVEAALAWRGRADGTPIIRRQGKDRWVDWRVIALPEGRTMLLHRDITDMKQNEIALRERTGELQEALDVQTATSDILKVISRSALDLDAVLNAVATAASKLCAADSVIIYRYQDGAYRFAGCGNVLPEYEQLERQVRIVPGRDTLIGRAALEQRTVHIVDGLADPEYADKDAFRVSQMRTILGVPLMRDGAPVGAIALARSKIQPFTGRQIEFVTIFADQAAIAIENARLFEESQTAHAAAEREHALMQAMLDNMTDGVALVEADGTIALWNDAIHEINGFPSGMFGAFRDIGEVLRWQFEHGHLPRGLTTLEADVAALLSRFLAGEPYTTTLPRPNGRWVEARWRVLPDGRRLLMHRDVTELKQRELELAAAHAATEHERALMQATLDNMTDGVALVEQNGDFVMTNGAYPFVNDMPAGEFRAIRNMRDAYLWQVRQGHVPVLGDTLDVHLELSMERFRIADGTSSTLQRPSGRWVEGRYIALPDGRRLNINRDVSELKQRERELEIARDAIERERTLMETVLDNMMDGVILWDAGGDWRYANKAFCDIQQSSLERLARLRTFAGMMDALLERALIDEPFRVAALERFRRADGTPKLRRSAGDRWVEGAFHRLADGGTLGIFRDVTTMKKQEDRLARERGLLQVMLDNMIDGVVLAEPDGAWILVNKPFYSINGWPPDVRSNSLSAEDVRWLLENGHLERKLPTLDEDIDRVRKRFVEADGTPRDFQRTNGNRVEVRWIILPDDRRLGMYRDITALKQQEQRIARERDAAETARTEAEAANQAKSTFLATMSHEIRTPMNGVLGMLEVLEHQGLDDAQRTTLGVMRESATALLRIIDDVLDFSKIEAGRLELEETPFSLSDLVTGAVRTFRPQAAAKRLAIGAALEPGSADALLGDPVRVQQILFNLLGNAVKFTEQGSVQVRAGTTPLGEGRQRVTLSVVDTGIGIDASQRDRLFQPFSQADSSTTRRFGGTGLGLSIVRRLAQLMDGDVAVESAPDHGSVFTVTLTLRAAPTRVRIPASRAGSESGAPAGRVLVVDDHPVNREVLLRQLGLLGIGADTAADGIEALQLWQPGRYVAVLADMHMPRMDGYGLTSAIRAREAELGAQRTPIVAVTANAMRGESERCLAAGMDAYLAKPVSLGRLSTTLQRWTPVWAPGAAAPPAPPAIDRAALRTWMGDDEGAIRAVLASFVESAREVQREIEAALATTDAAGLNAAAHKLKGASLTIGAHGLAAIATQLEVAAENAAWATCQAALGPLAAQLQLVKDEAGM